MGIGQHGEFGFYPDSFVLFRHLPSLSPPVVIYVQCPFMEVRPLVLASYHRCQWLMSREMNLTAGFNKFILLSVTRS